MENLSETQKCLGNISYMIEEYCFHNKLYPGQNEIFYNIQQNKNVLICKSRDIGYTHLMAALNACKMALNAELKNDKEYRMVYFAQNYAMFQRFKEIVFQYLIQIPEFLYKTKNIKTSIKKNSIDENKLGMLTIGNYTLEYININDFNINKCKHLYDNIIIEQVIYDEPATLNNNCDINLSYEFFKDKAKKIIIGGCGNHKNEKWFKFCKKLKNEEYPIVSIGWFTNPNHTSYYLNQLSSMLKPNDGEDNFEDEFGAKIFHYEKTFL